MLDPRWPLGKSQAVRRTGIGSSLSLPLARKGREGEVPTGKGWVYEAYELAHLRTHPAQPPGSFYGAVDARVSRYIGGGRSLSVGRSPSRVRHVATPNTVASQVAGSLDHEKRSVRCRRRSSRDVVSVSVYIICVSITALDIPEIEIGVWESSSTVVKDQSDGTGGTHRRTSSGVISRPRKEKKRREWWEREREIEKSRVGDSLEKREEEEGGGDYTACGLESTHEQVARRDYSRRTRWLAKRGQTWKEWKYNVCDEMHAGTVKEDFEFSSDPSFIPPPPHFVFY